MAEAVNSKKPWEMADDEEYCEFVRMQPTAEEAIKLALRESRFVTYWFPPYSSGASDMIDAWIRDMKTDWENQREKPEPVLNKLAGDKDFFGYGGPLCEPM